MRRSTVHACSKLITALCTGLAVSLGAAAQANDESVAKAKSAFIDKLVKQHEFDRKDLSALLDEAKINQTILDTIARPAERVVPWFEYRNIFLTEERIAAGARFWADHAETIDRIAERYDVAPEIIVAIVGVETFFGTRMGKYRVLDSLATLAFAYPPRSAFFTSELESFLLLAREERVDARVVLGSYAGAMGAGQFIPSSYRAYAVDADADGRRDLWDDWDDVLGSVANYLKVHGWQHGGAITEQATRSASFSGPAPGNGLDLDQTVGSLSKMGYVFATDLPLDTPAAAFALEASDGGSEYWIAYQNFRVITRYNRSAKYALAAHQLGQAIQARYTQALASNAGSVAE